MVVSQKNNYIGALWIKESDKGKFMSGNIEFPDGAKINITIFKNNNKKQSNHPDYNILLNNFQSDKREIPKPKSEDPPF
jgi:hypothetical protein